jgi:prepilin-type N-terminal cleavage/methylation domain-containing protein
MSDQNVSIRNKALHLNFRSRRGFTLVEVIVVLVILAILAAIAIPALTGYIDKANKRAYISNARIERTAAQTLLTEYYAEHGSWPATAPYGDTDNTHAYIPEKGYFNTVAVPSPYYCVNAVDPGGVWDNKTSEIYKAFMSLVGIEEALPRKPFGANHYRSDYIITSSCQIVAYLATVGMDGSEEIYCSYNFDPNTSLIDDSGYKLWKKPGSYVEY